MVSAIYICHWPDRDLEYLRCEVLLHRSYHNDVPSTSAIVGSFTKTYLAQPAHLRSPFLLANGVSYISLWAEHDMLLLAVARRNVNAMLVVSLLSQLRLLVGHYFSTKKVENGVNFTRDAVVDNHALVFELLDECVDFGLPQVTDYNILKEYIKMEVYQSMDTEKVSDLGLDSEPSRLLSTKLRQRKKKHKAHQKSDVKSTHNQAIRTDIVNDAAADYINSSIVRTQVSAISWRPKGIFYPKNEIYIDIVEECEFLYDLETSSVRTNHISGVCMVRSYLSGMPVCKLGLNERHISKVEYDADLDEEEPAASSPNMPLEGNQLQQLGEDAEQNAQEIVNTGDSQDSALDTHALNPAASRKVMKVPITNVQFHLCVELSKVYKENLIFFTPPDDEFRLFSYSVEQQRRKGTEPLFMVQPTYRVLRSQKKLQIMCSLHTNYRKKLHCHKVMVKVPISPLLFSLQNSDEDSFRFKCEMGEVRFSVDTSEVLWAIGDLPGSKKTVKMMAEVSLSHCENLTEDFIAERLLGKGKVGTKDASTDNLDSTIAELDKYYGVGNARSSVFEQLQLSVKNNSHEISISFEMPLFTYSGLKVIYLRVDEDTMKYTCFPWVRYATRASTGKLLSGSRFRYKLGASNFQVM